MPNPWSPEKRAQVKRQIDKAAERAAAKLGASHVAIVAFFPADGEHLHMLDGGSAPMPFDKLYSHMATAMAVMDESGGEDVALS